MLPNSSTDTLAAALNSLSPKQYSDMLLVLPPSALVKPLIDYRLGNGTFNKLSVPQLTALIYLVRDNYSPLRSITELMLAELPPLSTYGGTPVTPAFGEFKIVLGVAGTDIYLTEEEAYVDIRGQLPVVGTSIHFASALHTNYDVTFNNGYPQYVDTSFYVPGFPTSYDSQFTAVAIEAAPYSNGRNIYDGPSYYIDYYVTISNVARDEEGQLTAAVAVIEAFAGIGSVASIQYSSSMGGHSAGVYRTLGSGVALVGTRLVTNKVTSVIGF